LSKNALYVVIDSPTTGIDFLLKHLTADERERASRYRQEKAFRTFVIGRALLKNQLAEGLSQTARFELVYSKQGKPSLKQGTPYISISHSYPFIAVAISSSPIGVDVEWTRRRVRTQHASRFFSQEEISEWEQLSHADHTQRFFELWTLKEAWWKAFDLPYGIEVSEFTFRWSEDTPISLYHPTQTPPGHTWNYGWHTLPQQGLLAWAHEGPTLDSPQLIPLESLM